MTTSGSNSKSTAGRRSVAYLLTHHPRVSATFVTNEIHGLEARGFEVFPIAVNSPSDLERSAPGGAEEVARTCYLKATSKTKLLRVVASTFVRHPKAFLGTLERSMRTAHMDVHKVVWSAFHAVEAVVALDHCRRHGVRHVHAHFGGLPSTLAWLMTDLGNRIDGPGSWSFSFTVHGPHEIEDAKDVLLKQKFTDAAFVVTIADMTGAHMKRLTRRADWHKLHLIRCGVALDRFTYEPRAELSSPPKITTVARLDPEKGHLDLIEAVGFLRDRGCQVELDIVGDGPGQADIERLIAERRLSEQVRMLGALPSPKVIERLRSSDMFVLASYMEGIPIAIMEAMAVGVPVVATNVGGTGELVIDGVTGRLVAPARADFLADAIEWYLTHPAERADMVAAARRAVENSHDERTTILPLVELLEQATACHPPA